MTITKSAWDEIVAKYRSCIKINRKNDPNGASKDVLEAEGIQLVCDDILAELRNTPIVQYFDENSNSLKKVTCKRFVESFLKNVLKTLHNTTVDTYVICMDPFNARRIEKLATYLSRQRPLKEGVPEFLTKPRGQKYYFEDDCEMPGTMDLIFNTPEAKAELYEYITEYLKSEYFRNDIPENKAVIFSGALRINRSSDTFSSFHKEHVERLPPLYVAKSSHSFLEDMNSDHISEGDLDVWRWVDRFPSKSFRIKSNDCDVLLIGLLQMRHVIANNPDRRGWFVTRRSIGSLEISSEVTQRKETLKMFKGIAYVTTLEATGSVDEAYRASGGLVPTPSLFESILSSEPSTSYAAQSSHAVDDFNNEDEELRVSVPSDGSRKRSHAPDWADHHIDMFGIYKMIIAEAYHLVEKHCLPLQNPVETYVMCLCLASDKHDYIKTKLASPKIGSHYIWKALKPNLWWIGDMVRVYKSPSKSTSMDIQQTVGKIHYYAVDTGALKKLIQCAYMEKAKDSLGASKKNNTEEKLEKARKQKAEKMFKDNLSEDSIQLVAAQCAWVLQYWGNGVFSNYEIVDGLLTDEHEKSIYGYNDRGWADCVSHTELKIAPPLPEDF